MFIIIVGIGDWGLGIGDWGLGDGAQPQTPNPQSPTPKPHYIFLIQKKIIFKKFFWGLGSGAW